MFNINKLYKINDIYQYAIIIIINYIFNIIYNYISQFYLYILISFHF